MKWFINLSTFAKMMVGFGVLGLITAGIGGYGVTKLEDLNSSIVSEYQNQLSPLATVNTVQEYLQHTHQDSIRLVSSE